MKNSILKTSFAIILALTTTAVFSQNKETRDVSDFTSIGLAISAEVYISQGSPQKVVVSASEDQLEKIETSVKNGHLRIKSESWRTKFKNVKVWITAPEIDGLSVSGSGKIIAETPIKADKISFKISGSGKVNIDELDAGDVSTGISGSGHVHLGGTANKMGMSISGSGGVHARGLKVEEADVRISGSGSCRVDATGKLDASISGSGSVYYYSNPQIDARSSGSGKIRKGDK